MAHAQKRDLVFQRNGWVHLNWWVGGGGQFSRLLAAEVCASAVVMLYTPCSDVECKTTGYPLHSHVSPSLPLPRVTVCLQVSTELYNCKYKQAWRQCATHSNHRHYDHEPRYMKTPTKSNPLKHRHHATNIQKKKWDSNPQKTPCFHCKSRSAMFSNTIAVYCASLLVRKLWHSHHGAWKRNSSIETPKARASRNEDVWGEWR